MERLGSRVKPDLPVPRVLGNSPEPLTTGRDISKIRVYPEERSHRIDLCWGRQQSGRWVTASARTLDQIRVGGGRWNTGIWITGDWEVSSECPDYDVVNWRGLCLILASSPVYRLLEALGMGERFVRWLSDLFESGEIALEDRTVLKEQLVAAKGPEGAAIIPSSHSSGVSGIHEEAPRSAAVIFSRPCDLRH